jgi:hypothetical protein
MLVTRIRQIRRSDRRISRARRTPPAQENPEWTNCLSNQKFGNNVIPSLWASENKLARTEHPSSDVPTDVQAIFRQSRPICQLESFRARAEAGPVLISLCRSSIDSILTRWPGQSGPQSLQRGPDATHRAPTTLRKRPNFFNPELRRREFVIPADRPRKALPRLHVDPHNRTVPDDKGGPPGSVNSLLARAVHVPETTGKRCRWGDSACWSFQCTPIKARKTRRSSCCPIVSRCLMNSRFGTHCTTCRTLFSAPEK